MNESRRGFVKKAALAGAVTAVGVASLQANSSASNGECGLKPACPCAAHPCPQIHSPAMANVD